LGLIAAGLSTLEGIVQSLSTTITNDIIAPFAKIKEDSTSLSIINKVVIVILAVLAIMISYNQLINPNLSVGILAQNGVYAFFSAAFVPVLFGIFIKDTPKQAAIGASITAMVVHFSVYYGQLTPYTTGAIRNPAVAATLAIVSAVLVGLVLFSIYRSKQKIVINQI
ncbi:MAG: sodium:solute symporter, partial [Saprospiraceae bacterium]